MTSDIDKAIDELYRALAVADLMALATETIYRASPNGNAIAYATQAFNGHVSRAIDLLELLNRKKEAAA